MKKYVRMIGFLVCLAVVMVSGRELYGIYSEYATGTELYGELAEQYVLLETTADVGAGYVADGEVTVESQLEETGPPEIDFAALKAACPDVVAWVYCGGTPINYPIVQSEDNEYYLYRLMDGRENKNGTLFMDFRNAGDFSDWNSIIYGHNMHNDSMFGVVPEYMNQEFYDEHPVWYLLTEERDYLVELVGGYVTPADSDAYSFPTSAEEKMALSDKASRSSSFRSGVKVHEDERLVTFSTCVYDYENARYVLVGVLREVEKELQ